jgi:hypothetical protein
MPDTQSSKPRGETDHARGSWQFGFYVRNTMKFPLNPTAAALLELYTATDPFTVDAAAPRCTKKKQAITAGIRLSVMLHKCTFHFTAVWSVKMLQDIR